MRLPCDHHLFGSIEKIQRYFQFKNAYSLRAGLQETYEKIDKCLIDSYAPLEIEQKILQYLELKMGGQTRVETIKTNL